MYAACGGNPFMVFLYRYTEVLLNIFTIDYMFVGIIKYIWVDPN